MYTSTMVAKTSYQIGTNIRYTIIKLITLSLVSLTINQQIESYWQKCHYFKKYTYNNILFRLSVLHKLLGMFTIVRASLSYNLRKSFGKTSWIRSKSICSWIRFTVCKKKEKYIIHKIWRVCNIYLYLIFIPANRILFDSKCKQWHWFFFNMNLIRCEINKMYFNRNCYCHVELYTRYMSI